MSKKIFACAIVLMLAFLLSACSIDTSGKEDRIVVELGDDIVSAHTLTVSATGRVSVMPDVCYATVGVMTQDKEMTTAQQNNKDIMNTLFDALKASGLTDEDLRTTNYSAYPMYDYRDGKDVITGYQVTNTVEMTIKDIDSVGEFLDIAAENGANTSFSIRFSLLEEDEYYNEALKEAMEKARQKADAIAEAGGYEIIGSQSITEGGSDHYYPMIEYAADRADDSGGATPITTSELDVNASVTVVYEID
jgi:uncharacterized protein YggE